MQHSRSRRARAADHGSWVFACRPDNDLYGVVAAGFGQPPLRFDAPSAAVAQAPAGAAVLLLADSYPQHATVIEPAWFDTAAAKNLRLYVEYPASLPDLVVDSPRSAGIRRGVISSERFGPQLRPLRIVALHDCQFVPVSVTNALITLAKVAGVDTAVFGLSDTPTDPILFEHPRGRVLVATTKLSHFVTGRYLPSEAWGTIWETIFRWLQPQATPPTLRWTPTVRPSYRRDEPLPADAEAQAIRRSADWIFRSRILRHPAWPRRRVGAIADLQHGARPAARPTGRRATVRSACSKDSVPRIRLDGSQPMRYAVRNDCMLEVAMLLALDALQPGSPRKRPDCQQSGRVPLPALGSRRRSPGRSAAALPTAWSAGRWIPPARTGATTTPAPCSASPPSSVALRDARWDEPLARCLLANFRTTGRTGFREACVTDEPLRANGWRPTGTRVRSSTRRTSRAGCGPASSGPTSQTHFEPLRERSLKRACVDLMAAYPRAVGLGHPQRRHRTRARSAAAGVAGARRGYARAPRLAAPGRRGPARHSGRFRRDSRDHRDGRHGTELQRRIRHARDEPDPDQRRPRVRPALHLQFRPDRPARGRRGHRRATSTPRPKTTWPAFSAGSRSARKPIPNWTAPGIARSISGAGTTGPATRTGNGGRGASRPVGPSPGSPARSPCASCKPRCGT